MKIIGLYAENIKRLSAVEIAPEGAIVKITGRNGQGKTSILDAIWWALKGAKHIQSAPIRNGQNEARIRLDLGELKVTRHLTRLKDGEITTSIVVENEKGARFPSPQKTLDELVGALSMDPLEFMRSKPEDQLASLRGFVEGVDFDALKKADATDFKERTEMNRQAKALRAQAAGINYPAGSPTERVDDAALVEQLEQAGEHNTLIERRKAKREEAVREAQQFKIKFNECIARAEQHEAEAARFRQLAGGNDDRRMELQAALDAAEPLPEPIDTADLRRQITEAKETNALVAMRERRAEIESQAKDAEGKAEALTAAMDNRAAEVKAAVEAAKMPIPGLGFGDDEV
jgi:chromosome segregation ATPase